MYFGTHFCYQRIKQSRRAQYSLERLGTSFSFFFSSKDEIVVEYLTRSAAIKSDPYLSGILRPMHPRCYILETYTLVREDWGRLREVWEEEDDYEWKKNVKLR